MKLLAFASMAMAALLSLVSAQEEFAHGVSLAHCAITQHVVLLFSLLTNIAPEMRFRPTLPFGASRWNAVLVQMRPRGTMHLQWLRRLHALQYQQWIRQLRVKASA